MSIIRVILVPVVFVTAMIWTIGVQAAKPIVVIASFNVTGPEAVVDAPCYKGAELAVESLTPRVVF